MCKEAPEGNHVNVARDILRLNFYECRKTKMHLLFLHFISIYTRSEKYNVSLRKLLQQGISELEFYGDLVYRIRKNVGKSNISEQFRNLINCYKRIGYNPYVMRQAACLVIKPNSVDNYTSLFTCTTAGRASDSMTAST